MSRVFISHAAKDESLVDAFFDLLQTGIGLSPNDTFCSSLEGMGIPAGENFVSYIKSKVQNQDLMLLMLSPNYLESLFCQCELGAGWVLSHNLVPIVVPPTTYSDVKAVLTGIHAYKLDADTDLSELRDQVISLLRMPASNTARWDAKKKKFLQALPGILSGITVPDKVSLSDHQKLQANYDESVNELKVCFDEIESLKKQIERLMECKDRDDVSQVVQEFSDDWKWFKSLCEAAAEYADRLPSVVIEAIYHEESELEGIPRGQDMWDDIRNAAQEDYIDISTDMKVSVNSDDPKVARYIDAVNNVACFLSNLDEDAQFIADYSKKYVHRPVFTSRKLWEEHLGLSSFTKW